MYNCKTVWEITERSQQHSRYNGLADGIQLYEVAIKLPQYETRKTIQPVFIVRPLFDTHFAISKKTCANKFYVNIQWQKNGINRISKLK